MKPANEMVDMGHLALTAEIREREERAANWVFCRGCQRQRDQRVPCPTCTAYAAAMAKGRRS